MLDNIFTLVILYTSMNLPIAIWMMRSFLAEVPVEILEAAQVDGAGLLRIAVVGRRCRSPRPGLAATSLICFIFSWNEFMFAVNLTATRGLDGADLPGRLHLQPGPVPRQAVRGRDAGLAAGADRRVRRAGQAGARAVARARSSDGAEPPATSGRSPSTYPVPGYDRSAVRTGIVHFGVGGFHRAHEAMYVDSLLSAGEAIDWGITGVGLLPRDRRMHEVMQAQDCLYTLVVKDADGTMHPRVIGSIVDYLFAPDDPEAVLARMADPATRIVSLTITEGGYHVNQATGEFDDSDPAIRADLEADAAPDHGVRLHHRGAAPGVVTAGTEPFTVMSCDNIQGNGDRRARDDHAPSRPAQATPSSAAWIERARRVPELDGRPDHAGHHRRATASTSPSVVRHRGRLAGGLRAVHPVGARGPLPARAARRSSEVGRAGGRRTSTPYELMKLRLLNASHQAMCYLGYLSRLPLRARGVQRPAVHRLPARLHGPTRRRPTLEPVPGVDLDDYKHQLIERFANPEIKDTLARLCAESSDRIPKWLVPVIRHQLAHDGRGRPVGAGRGGLGALRRGRRRGRASRSTSSTAARTQVMERAQRRPTTRWPSCEDPRPVRRPRRRRALHRGVPRGAGLAARARRPRDARGVGADA